jgi:hypothetical protein
VSAAAWCDKLTYRFGEHVAMGSAHRLNKEAIERSHP